MYGKKVEKEAIRKPDREKGTARKKGKRSSASLFSSFFYGNKNKHKFVLEKKRTKAQFFV